MRYNPIPNTDEDLTDYRGSIVHLTPATTYEIQLTLAGSSTTTNLTATTWSEDFQSARRSAHATATRLWRSPSPARLRLTGSTTAGT